MKTQQSNIRRSMETKFYSWNRPLRTLGLPQPWQNLEKEYQAELTKELADHSSNYDKIVIDAADGDIWISVSGVKPELGKFLEDNYEAEGEEE